jgi:hypothetical protein
MVIRRIVVMLAPLTVIGHHSAVVAKDIRGLMGVVNLHHHPLHQNAGHLLKCTVHEINPTKRALRRGRK